MQDCTIILQGRINKECFDLWIKNHSEKNVVVSIWSDEDLSEFNIPNNWNVLINEYPLVRFRKQANLDYQIITTLKALQNVKTPFVIKMRCDEYWSNIEKIYLKMKNSPDKIISGSMFFRKSYKYKFHPSDKIIGGTKDNLKIMFEETVSSIEKNIWNTKIPESLIGFSYVYAKESEIDLKNKSLEKLKVVDEQILKNQIVNGLKIVVNESKNNLIPNLVSNDFDWETIKQNLERYKGIFEVCAQEASNLISTEIDDIPYMKKWFDVIDVNELKPYIATCNKDNKRIWFRDNFNNDENDCYTNIISD